MKKQQKYHLEPSTGLLNDPNGLAFYKGLYHVFFQWNRFKKDHSYKEWGHFTSKDLVKWKWEGSALIPDQPYEKNGVYSGSALVKDGQLFLYYTGNAKNHGIRKSSQCLAVTEDGKTFIKKGIVLSTPSEFTEHFRDPKIWEKENKYYMIIGGQKKNGKGAVALCSSADAKEWEFQQIMARSTMYEMIECPDYFEIENKKILLYCLQHRDNEQDCCISSFSVYKEISQDRENLKEENLDEGYQKLDQGFDFYAPQTFQAPDGRRILFAWMSRMEEEEEQLFSKGEKNIHCMTIPREISYKKGRLCQMPVKELQEKLILQEAKGKDGVAAFESRVYCIKLRNIENERSWTIDLQNGEVYIEYEKEQEVFHVKRKNWRNKKLDERICNIKQLHDLEIWTDTSSIEIFVNGGVDVFSMRVFPESGNGSMKITGLSEEAIIKTYKIQLQSAEEEIQ